MKRFLFATLAVALAVSTAPAHAETASAYTGRGLTFAPCNSSTTIQVAQQSKTVASGTSPSATPTPAAPGQAQNANVAIENGGIVNRTVISGATIQQSAQTGTYEAIKGVPGVQDTQTRASSGADSLQIRGIKLDNSSNYRMDGALVMNNQINLPLEDKCKIEALKGAGALQFGIASPAGIVNYILKRATLAPVAAVGFSGNEYGQAIESVDLGERFGFEKQFGYRINLAEGQMGSVAKGAGGRRYVGAFAGDWYIGKRAAVQVDFEQLGINLIEQSSLLLNKPVKGQIALPDANRIDPRNLLSGDWAWSRGWEQNMVAHLGYAVSPNTTFTFETGQSEADRPERNVSQIGNYNALTGAGTATVTFVRGQNYINTFYDATLDTRTEGAHIANDLELGFNFNSRDFNNPQSYKTTYKQNIYDPVVVAAPIDTQTKISYLPDISHDTDPYFSDTISFNNRLQLIGGLRQIGYYESVGQVNGSTKADTSSTLAPAAGIIYDIRPNVSVYASYVQSLEQTGQAPASAANAYQVLPPAKASQKEVGIRAGNIGIFTPTVAYFRISQANATTDPVTNVFALNGTITYEGLESTVTAHMNHWLQLDGSGIWMRGVQISDDPSINGLPPENMPHLSYRLGVEYTLPFAPAYTVNAGSSFLGWRYANPQNQAVLANVGLFQLGARYATRVDGRPLSIGLECSNLFDKRYLSSAINGNLGVGAPRNITLNARIGI